MTKSFLKKKKNSNFHMVHVGGKNNLKKSNSKTLKKKKKKGTKALSPHLFFLGKI